MTKGRWIAAAIALASTPASAHVQTAPGKYDNPAWLEPTKPFRMAGPIHYVGSKELSAFLIDTGKGLILIDAGVPEYAPTLLANVRALGFDPKQIKILLNSQSHLDHAGGLAAIKAATGARMLASAGDRRQLEEGGKGDFAWGDDLTFPPVKVDGIVRDGQRIRLGNVTLTAHLTPGHTKGCTTWTMPVAIGGRTRIAQFNCSTSVPGYKLLGTPAYPNMAADYARTFDKLRTIKCDIFLGSHASFFDMEEKRAKLGTKGENPFVDPQGCRRYLDRMEASFRQQLAREQIEARKK